MKVILLQDVANVGRRFEIAEVPNGYALNQLIPSGKAEAATPENVKKAEVRAAKAAASKLGDETSYAAAVEALRAEQLLLTASANEQQHLFEAIKPATIVEAAEKRSIQLAPENIKMAEPIKTLGEHQIELVYGDRAEGITIVVERV